MKKYIAYGLTGVLLLLCSCYEDKGTYSYGEINEMTLSFSPATTSSNADLYLVPKPAKDTLYFELTPVVDQTVQADESNLEYRWMVLREKVEQEEKFDTAYVKTYTFKFAPGVDTSYTVLFSVRDRGTDVERYRRLKVKTIVPYIRNWLILHGQAGDRKIAALEYDSTGMNLSRRVEDIYYDVNHERRFQNAFALGYVSDVMPRSMSDKERLYILEPDNCYWLYPFNSEFRADKEEMMPDAWNGTFKTCFDAHTTNYIGILDEVGNYYHCGAFGFFYLANYKEENAGEPLTPRIEWGYVNTRGQATLWDKANKKFMYYEIGWDYGSRDYNRQPDSKFKDWNIIAFPDSTLQGIDRRQDELIWLGHGVTVDNNQSGSSAIFYDPVTGASKLFNIWYATYTDHFLKTEVRELQGTVFNKDTRFSVTDAYSEQLFYTVGSKIYIYNTVSHYSAFLYSVGEGRKITKLDFRMVNRSWMKKDIGAEKILGIGVETAGGEGEFHELFLDEAGDLIKSEIYRGFGPVIDFCYTYIMHAAYDL